MEVTNEFTTSRIIFPVHSKQKNVILQDLFYSGDKRVDKNVFRLRVRVSVFRAINARGKLLFVFRNLAKYLISR